uniref:Uncharacterized protein n=1 Tax=Panagrolaimus sp. PS1159 TaxID=55785 RepID=A0AC35GX57_9BILA
MKFSSSCLIFFAVITVAACQNASTTVEPAFRSIKISFDAFETIGGKALWKIWLNIPQSEQECLQGAVKNELRNYLSGTQSSIIGLPAINKTCPDSFKQFKTLYQQMKKKVMASVGKAKTKLPKSVVTALVKVYATFSSYRSKQQLKNDTQKIAVIQVLLDAMDKIPAADMVKVGKIYPQISNIVQGDGAQNLKAVINDYTKKLKGQEYNQDEAKQRLQTLLNAIKDGYVKAQKN